MTNGPHKVPASSPGAVGSYIHAGGKIGVLLELGCESEFVSGAEEFSELLHDIAMQIAASDPKFIPKEDVTAEAYQREKDVYASLAAAMAKSPQVVEKIVEGKMSKFYDEACLNEQPFIKDQAIKISDLIAAKANKLGEKITVRRLHVSKWAIAFRQEFPPGNTDPKVRFWLESLSRSRKARTLTVASLLRNWTTSRSESVVGEKS